MPVRSRSRASIAAIRRCRRRDRRAARRARPKPARRSRPPWSPPARRRPQRRAPMLGRERRPPRSVARARSRSSLAPRRRRQLAGCAVVERRRSAGRRAERARSAARSRGVATPEAGAAGEPLEVGDVGQSLRGARRAPRARRPAARPRPGGGGCARRRQREQQPAAQQAAARRGRGLVEHVEQRARRAAIDQRLDQLEVRARLLVEDQRVGARVDAQPRDRQRRRRLGRARVREHARRRRPRRGARRRARVEPGSDVGAATRRRGPPLVAGRDASGGNARVARAHELDAAPRPSSSAPSTSSRGATRADLVEQRLGASARLGGAEVAGRDVEVREPEPAARVAGDGARRSSARAARATPRRGRRPGVTTRTTSRLTMPLRPSRVLDLLAERDLVAELGELRAGSRAPRGAARRTSAPGRPCPCRAWSASGRGRARRRPRPRRTSRRSRRAGRTRSRPGTSP